MTRRTRKFIIDNTTGTVYSNVTDVANATNANISAGVSPKILKTTITSPGKNIVVVNANKPINFGRNVLINNVSLSVLDRSGRIGVTAAPTGSGITVRLRKVTAAGAESTLGTFSLGTGTTASSTSVSFAITSTDSLFYDVTAIGSSKPGHGLTVTTSFFG
jgi:hypothetical protein